MSYNGCLGGAGAERMSSSKETVDERIKRLEAEHRDIADEVRTSIRFLKAQKLALIEHQLRLSEQQPGVSVHESDAIRSLIMLGNETAREAERKVEREEAAARVTSDLKPHVYRQNLSEEQLERIKIQNLGEIRTGRVSVLTADGVDTVQYQGKHRVVGGCWIYPDHKAPKRDGTLHPVTIPFHKNHFHCQGRDGIDAHDISIEEYLLHAHPDTKERREHLKGKVRLGHPELFRFSVFELDGQIGVALGQDDALAELDLGDAESVRGLMIEAASITSARQIAGQLRDKLPWCEAVKLNRDGAIAELDWHGGRLTPREKEAIAARRQQARFHENEILQAEAKVAALRRRKGELGL